MTVLSSKRDESYDWGNKYLSDFIFCVALNLVHAVCLLYITEKYIFYEVKLNHFLNVG